MRKCAQDMYNIQNYKARSVYQQKQHDLTMAIIPSMNILGNGMSQAYPRREGGRGVSIC